MRGERPPPRIDPLLDHGSSPHARGTRLRVLHGLDVLRFIPACAGNAWLRSMRCRPSSVHPRMRGERQFWADSGRRRYGSSPHARGTPHGIRWFENPIRFIPACAGNAERSSGLCGQQTVHPRMRGERCVAYFTASRAVGSSPHARGTLRFGQPHACGQRFIPACAGNAHRERREREHHAVHPRMRGERARRGARRGVGRRFIPACAGNARLIIRRSSWPAVHPRMRGERNLSPTPMPSPTGSSPHARGTLQGRK